MPDRRRAAELLAQSAQNDAMSVGVGGEPIPAYAMLDVWQALGGDYESFDRMWNEERRTPADTWSQLLSAIRGDGVLWKDRNPPAGPEFERLLAGRRALDEEQD